MNLKPVLHKLFPSTWHGKIAVTLGYVAVGFSLYAGLAILSMLLQPCARTTLAADAFVGTPGVIGLLIAFLEFKMTRKLWNRPIWQACVAYVMAWFIIAVVEVLLAGALAFVVGTACTS